MTKDINLFVEEKPAAGKKSADLLIISILIIAILSIIIFEIVLPIYRYKRSKIKLDIVKCKANENINQEAEYEDLTSRYNTLVENLDVIDSLDHGEPMDWFEVLEDISNSLPESMVIESLISDNRALLISGVCTNETDVISFIDSLNETKLFREIEIEHINYIESSQEIDFKLDLNK